jgi:hypothetical protein
MMAAAWFARPTPIREQIERAGIHLTFKGGTRYEIDEGDARKLRALLYDVGYKTGTQTDGSAEGGYDDFGRMFVLERREFFIPRVHRVFVDEDTAVGGHQIGLDIDPTH